MGKICTIIFLTLCCHKLIPVSGTGKLECIGSLRRRSILTLSLNSKRYNEEEWVTTFSAFNNTEGGERNVKVDSTNMVVKRGEKLRVKVHGLVKDCTLDGSRKGLYFHSKGSSNAAVTNGNKTLQKVKPRGCGSALTDRPLLDDEVFTVRIDDLAGGLNFGIGIGVTTHAPGTFEIPNNIKSIKNETWMFYHKLVHYNSRSIKHGYNLFKIKVGQHIGVMRSKFGTLHLFVDGVDQGPAISNVPDKVYGALDLFWSVLKATIVDS